MLATVDDWVEFLSNDTERQFREYRGPVTRHLANLVAVRTGNDPLPDEQLAWVISATTNRRRVPPELIDWALEADTAEQHNLLDMSLLLISERSLLLRLLAEQTEMKFVYENFWEDVAGFPSLARPWVVPSAVRTRDIVRRYLRGTPSRPSVNASATLRSPGNRILLGRLMKLGSADMSRLDQTLRVLADLEGLPYEHQKPSPQDRVTNVSRLVTIVRQQMECNAVPLPDRLHETVEAALPEAFRSAFIGRRRTPPPLPKPSEAPERTFAGLVDACRMYIERVVERGGDPATLRYPHTGWRIDANHRMVEAEDHPELFPENQRPWSEYNMVRKLANENGTTPSVLLNHVADALGVAPKGPRRSGYEARLDQLVAPVRKAVKHAGLTWVEDTPCREALGLERDDPLSRLKPDILFQAPSAKKLAGTGWEEIFRAVVPGSWIWFEADGDGHFCDLFKDRTLADQQAADRDKNSLVLSRGIHMVAIHHALLDMAGPNPLDEQGLRRILEAVIADTDQGELPLWIFLRPVGCEDMRGGYPPAPVKSTVVDSTEALWVPPQPRLFDEVCSL